MRRWRVGVALGAFLWALAERHAAPAERQAVYDSGRIALGARRTLDAFVDLFNVTNRANFESPATGTTGVGANGGNIRIPGEFLRLKALVGGTGFPRQAQVGLRFGF